MGGSGRAGPPTKIEQAIVAEARARRPRLIRHFIDVAARRIPAPIQSDRAVAMTRPGDELDLREERAMPAHRSQHGTCAIDARSDEMTQVIIA
jgi:hypothetical protein